MERAASSLKWAGRLMKIRCRLQLSRVCRGNDPDKSTLRWFGLCGLAFAGPSAEARQGSFPESIPPSPWSCHGVRTGSTAGCGSHTAGATHQLDVSCTPYQIRPCHNIRGLAHFAGSDPLFVPIVTTKYAVCVFCWLTRETDHAWPLQEVAERERCCDIGCTLSDCGERQGEEASLPRWWQCHIGRQEVINDVNPS